MKLSSRAANLTPSITLAISAKAKKMRAEGIDVIGLSAGEPDFDTPDAIKNAAIKALDNGFTKYTPAAGTLELRKAIAEYYKQEYGLPYDFENILVSVGGKGVCYTFMQAVLDPGDEVLIISPYWVSYPSMVELAGGIPVYVETTDATGFLADAKMIEEKITDKTKLLILNSPSNPTGAAYDEKLLAEIAELVIEKDLLVMSDEIYDRIVYDGFEFVPFPKVNEKLLDRCLIANGVSKTYSMTGWRLGWGAGPKEIIQGMTRIQSHANSGTCSFVQSGALEAITGDQDDLSEMLGAFSRRRELILDALSKIKGIEVFNPQGAFYVFPKVCSFFGKSFNGKTIDGSMAMADFLLDEAKVAVVPGVGFGADDYIRLSYATDDDSIIEGVKRIAKALDQLV